MAKTFLKSQDRTVPTVGKSILGSLLSDDDEPPAEGIEPVEKPTLQVQPPEPTVTVVTNKPEKTERPRRPAYVISTTDNKTDKRKSDDKKVVFTNSIKGSIKRDIEEILPKYRKKIDVDYNLAQLLEDAIVGQLDKMKSKL
jgi:hypothetical protein